MTEEQAKKTYDRALKLEQEFAEYFTGKWKVKLLIYPEDLSDAYMLGGWSHLHIEIACCICITSEADR